MPILLRAKRAATPFLLLVALFSGCTKDEEPVESHDAAARCRNDPNCRGQKCADVRADLYTQGEYKAASTLDCSPGRL